MSQSRDLPLIGVVGGIGSGKSTVSRALANRRPVVILDADKIGHELLNDPSVVEEITRTFGPSVLADDGSLSRRAIADKVFGQSSEQQRALKALNSILHPRIRKEIQRILQDVAKHGQADAVILDAALLLEAGWRDDCDAVVFVDTPETTRRRRVVRDRGWTEEEFIQREQTQLAPEEKKQLSDFVIDNSTTIENAAEAFAKILDRLLAGSVPA